MPIPRLHLFELEDQQWFPALIRDFATDHLHFVQSRFALHRPMVPILKDALLESNARRIVDLCSGGSGPILSILNDLRADGLSVHATLTDKFPNLPAFERARSESGISIDFIPESVDARAVPHHLDGFRTMFNSFHHFRPGDARQILRDAVVARQPIGIFEMPERSLPVILSLVLAPFMVLLTTPFMRPFEWSRLLYTYVLPLVPLTALWDGVVSQLRAYTVQELTELTSGLRRDDYVWKAGRASIPRSPAHITYLVGYPSQRDSAVKR